MFRRKNNICEYSRVVIGDTVAATLYVDRLLRNGCKGDIYLITKGYEPQEINNISDPNYIFDSYVNNSILGDLQSLNVNYYLAGSDTSNTPLITANYDFGKGVNGDFVSSYYIPFVGPWYPTKNEALDKFLNCSTQAFCLNSAEKTVVQELSNIWNIPSIGSYVTNTPAIINKNYLFMCTSGGNAYRELFLDEYNRVVTRRNVVPYTGVKKISFEPATSGNSKLRDATLTFTSENDDVILNDVLPTFRTNPFSYLEISTNGNIQGARMPRNLNIPTIYRSVISIPKNNTPNGGVDLTDLPNIGDLVTSQTSFSLYDFKVDPVTFQITVRYNKQIRWLIHGYTAEQDLSRSDSNKLSASEGNTLLIVEGISINNKRETLYNTENDAVEVMFNDSTLDFSEIDNQEEDYILKFAVIVGSIYNVYTGLNLDINTIRESINVCSGGICFNTTPIIDIARRQSPMISVLSLANNLYGDTNLLS